MTPGDVGVGAESWRIVEVDRVRIAFADEPEHPAGRPRYGRHPGRGVPMELDDAVRTRWDRLVRAWRADRPAQTVLLARELLDVAPDFGPAWQVLGETLADLARHDEAEDALLRALELSPPDGRHRPLRALGTLARGRGDFDRAADWFGRAIEAAPRHASAYIYLGGMLASLGRLAEAEGAYRRATLCLDGCIEEAYHNLGLVLRARERFGEAAACFEKALAIDPEYRAARRALRDVRRCQGRRWGGPS